MNESVIKALKVQYDKEVHLSLLKRINPDYGIKYLIEQLTEENWPLYNVVINDVIIGIFVCRLEEQITGKTELVILHTVSVLRQEIPFVVIIEPLIDEIARQSKCSLIRIYADNPAICKLIEKHTLNYKVTQTIYTKEI